MAARIESYLCVLSLVLFWINVCGGLPACDSKIWCDGPLLHDVQMAGIYKDSKTFVDMNIKVDPEMVISAYTNLSHGSTPSKAQLKSFIDEYFEGPGTEFEDWTPEDYVENPAFLDKLPDAKLKDFASNLCKIWSHLGRKIKDDVRRHQERYSLIYLKNPFIVPGGRFREIYYWDSYWTIKGLLKCEMTSTVKGMLENFITFVQSYGHVPNGGRVYYTRRSQPPFLIPMVDLYVSASGDTAFLRDNIDFLVEEYNFWAEHRNVTTVNMHRLNRYATPITTPRPESHKEDFELGETLQDEGKKQEFYSNIASAAESGWDFSTRWFATGYNNDVKSKWLLHVDTKNVLPVDLNSVLCWNEKLLASFHKQLGNQSQSEKWSRRHTERVNAVDEVFWSMQLGSWFDYRISDTSHYTIFYPSNMFPLYTGCYQESRKLEYETKMMEYLKNNTVFNYVSGIPTSLTKSGQQWDFPNAWPPLMHAMIISLAEFSSGEGRDMALQLAQKWIDSNYEGWKRTGKMFEKYVVTSKGSRGEGGEYDVQEGFGWTNGVALDLLDKFGPELHVTQEPNNAHAQYVGTSLMASFAVILCRLIM